MFEFKLPDVGEGIFEAEILDWLVKEGDTVTQDQVILEIQTDKAVVEIPSPVAGTIQKIVAQPGTMANVGDLLVIIATEEGASLPPADPNKTTAQAPAMQQHSVMTAPEAPPPGGNGKTKPAPAPTPMQVGILDPNRRVLAAPAVRKLALEMGINLAQVPGTGPAGRILLSDLKQFAAQPQPAPTAPPPSAPPQPAAPATAPTAPPPPAPTIPDRIAVPSVSTADESVEEEPLRGLRRRIAERMEVSLRVPSVSTFREIEVGRLVEMRKTLKPIATAKNLSLTFMPFFIKAATIALKEFPYFNATLDMDNQKIIRHNYYHIGIATATDDGLLVPVIKHADKMTILELASELTRLRMLAERRKLAPDELSGSTFSITNYGSYNGWMGTPIINPPEVAIMGVGRITEKPVAINGEIVIRPVLPLSLSFDHRLIDGAAGEQFAERLQALLGNPDTLLLEMR